MSATARAWSLAFALAAAVVAADQAAKAAAEARLAVGEKVEMLGPLGLTLSHNRGVAFGLAEGGGVPLILFALAALGVVAFFFARDPTRPGMWVAAGLLAGGAVGNIVDRVRAGAVTDFLDLASWPAFNLADVAITAGILLLLFLHRHDMQRGAGDG